MNKVRAITLTFVVTAFVAMLVLGVSVKRVASGSMEPELPVGSLIFIREQPHYMRGDIIVFPDDEGRAITHRLVDYGDGGSLITKGDANPTHDIWDRPLTEDDVIGKVILKTAPIMSAGFWVTLRGLLLAGVLAAIMGALFWRRKTTDTTPDAEASVTN